MDEKIDKYLEDISTAIDEINSFTLRFGRRFEIFKTDMLFYKAILMNIAIIGEAISKILKIKSDIPISSARKIVDTRNYVIHGYDSLTPEILWNIVINHLPKLQEEVKNLRKHNNS